MYYAMNYEAVLAKLSTVSTNNKDFLSVLNSNLAPKKKYNALKKMVYEMDDHEADVYFLTDALDAACRFGGYPPNYEPQTSEEKVDWHETQVHFDKTIQKYTIQKPRFKYIWDFEPSEYENVSSIEFDISRYGDYTKTIKFPKKVTVEDAVKHAEEFLSKPYSRNHYSRVKGDLLKDLKYTTYGDLLGDAIIIERIKINETSAYIETAS